MPRIIKQRERHLPVQDHDLLDVGLLLGDPGGDGDVVKEAEAHMFIGLRVVAGGADDREGLLQLAARDGETGLDDTTAAEARGARGALVDVERHGLVVGLGVDDFLFCHR